MNRMQRAWAATAATASGSVVRPSSRTRTLPLAFVTAGFAAGAILAEPAALAQEPRYTFTILPGTSASRPHTSPNAINDAGVVVGLLEGAMATRDALVWSPGGDHRPFNLGEFLGLPHSVATDINNSNRLVGVAAANPFGTHHAFVFARGQGATRLPGLEADPAFGSSAAAISDGGLIAGSCDVLMDFNGDRILASRAVVWDAAGNVTDVGTLGGDVAWASAVNDSGVAAGLSNSSVGTLVHAFAWTQESGMTRLPGIDGTQRTWANDINDAGVIVGNADLDPWTHEPAAWLPPDYELTLLERLEGDSMEELVAVNDRGQAVGSGTSDDFLEIRPRLWIGVNGYDLPSLVNDLPATLDLINAYDINDAGQIVCWGLDFADPSRPVSVSMLLTPVD